MRVSKTALQYTARANETTVGHLRCINTYHLFCQTPLRKNKRCKPAEPSCTLLGICEFLKYLKMTHVIWLAYYAIHVVTTPYLTAKLFCYLLAR